MLEQKMSNAGRCDREILASLGAFKKNTWSILSQFDEEVAPVQLCCSGHFVVFTKLVRHLQAMESAGECRSIICRSRPP